MSKRIFNNIFLKIISIVFAFIAWLILVNVSDPTTSITVSGINVRFENEDTLFNSGYTYEVVDGGKISVDISGPKSDITSIGAGDIDATADLGELSAFSDYVDINVRVLKDGNQLRNIKATPKTSSVQLSISNRDGQEYNVIPSQSGTPASGYILSDATVTPNTVRLAGPVEDMEKIAYVKAVCDINGKDSDISEDVFLKIFDEDDNEITDSRVELSRSMVHFTATMERTKTIKINIGTQGKVADEHTMNGIDLSTTIVTIKGDEAALDALDEFNIPSSALDIDGLSYTKSFKIWLSDFAPDGIEVVSDNSLIVTVYVSENNTHESSGDDEYGSYDELDGYNLSDD